MIIIADTSALVALAICDVLGLLETLFDKVMVPKKVYDECIVANKSQAEKLKFFLHDKIKTTNKAETLSLPANLGAGEISAMLLYKKTNADYLLIDDNRARKIARYNDINIIGSLGVLLLAKKEKLIKEIVPFLNKLEQSGLYISEQLVREVKKTAKE